MVVTTRRLRSAKQTASPHQQLPNSPQPQKRKPKQTSKKKTVSATPEPEVVQQEQPSPEKPIQEQDEEADAAYFQVPQKTNEAKARLLQARADKLSRLRQYNFELEKQNTKLQNENASLTESLTDYLTESVTESLRAEVQLFRTNCNSLQTAYHSIQTENSSFKREITKLKSEQVDSENQCLTLREAIHKLEEEKRQLLERNCQLQGLLTNYQGQILTKEWEANVILSEFAKYRYKHPDAQWSRNAKRDLKGCTDETVLLIQHIHGPDPHWGEVSDWANASDAEPSLTSPATPSTETFVTPSATPSATQQTPSATQHAPSATQHTPSVIQNSPSAASSASPAAEPAVPTTPSTNSWFNRLSTNLSGFKPFGFFSTPRHSSTPAPSSLTQGTTQTPTPKPAPAPAPGSLAEVLTQTPTPIGERTRRMKTKKRNPLVNTLKRGMKPNEHAVAQSWLKDVLWQLGNDPNAGEKRKRLEAPVQLKDLKTLPSHKPWESGFGDPLEDYDDDDVVPVWAVYQDMMYEEEHKKKKHKTTHEFTIDDELPSFDASLTSITSNKTIDSNGNSTSPRDMHPRSSVVPSPMFKNPVIHQGGNVFSSKGKGHATEEQAWAQEHGYTAKAGKAERIPHNPTKGSFSCPESDSDENEIAGGDQEKTPLWTQPPPAAPVPAHASLPISLSTDPAMPRDEHTPSTTPLPPSQPVDEVERQRAKLMKHTPAKPSRLRETNYPSPSVRSDAGNDSIIAGTPVAPFACNLPSTDIVGFNDAELEGTVLGFNDEMKGLMPSMFNTELVVAYDEEESMSGDE